MTDEDEGGGPSFIETMYKAWREMDGDKIFKDNYAAFQEGARWAMVLMCGGMVANVLEAHEQNAVASDIDALLQKAGIKDFPHRSVPAIIEAVADAVHGKRN